MSEHGVRQTGRDKGIRGLNADRLRYLALRLPDQTPGTGDQIEGVPRNRVPRGASCPTDGGTRGQDTGSDLSRVTAQHRVRTQGLTRGSTEGEAKAYAEGLTKGANRWPHKVGKPMAVQGGWTWKGRLHAGARPRPGGIIARPRRRDRGDVGGGPSVGQGIKPRARQGG